VLLWWCYFYFSFSWKVMMVSQIIIMNPHISDHPIFGYREQPATRNTLAAFSSAFPTHKAVNQRWKSESRMTTMKMKRSKTILYSVDGRSEQTRWAGKNMNPQYTSLYENVESVCSFPPMVAFLTGATTLTFLGMTESLAQLSTHLPTRWTISSLSISTNRLFDS
jgi:hypothetical protein